MLSTVHVCCVAVTEDMHCFDSDRRHDLSENGRSQYLPDCSPFEKSLPCWRFSMALISLVILTLCLSLDDVPTTTNVFHCFRLPQRHYLILAHWPLFRARTKSGPVPESVETWPCAANGPSSPIRRLGNKLIEANPPRYAVSVQGPLSSFERSNHGVWSYVGPLATRDGQLFLPVFLSGTGGPNTARRHQARSQRLTCGHRENTEA